MSRSIDSSRTPSSAGRWIRATLRCGALVWLFGASVARAAWSSDPGTDVTVSSALGHQTQVVAARDGSGGAIIAWVDTRGGASDIYAQRLDVNGVVPAGWPTDGRPICTASSSQTSVRILEDGSGGAILTWMDSRSGNLDLYAQRVTGGGAIAPGWPTNGIAICTASGTQANPSIVTDSNHGAIIAWQDGRSGTSLDVYAQHLLSTGAVDASWPVNGRAVSTAPADQFFPKLLAVQNGTIVVWEDTRNPDPDIFAQRIDGLGAPQWGANGVVVCSAPGTQEAPVVAGDGSNGAFVCWTDYRVPGETDVYGQHVTSSGAIAPFWIASGNAIAAALGDQSSPAITADGAGGFYAAWVDTRRGGEDIYLQRMDGLGAIPPGQWMDGGIPVCAAAGDQSAPMLVADGAGGLIAAWRDMRNDKLGDIFGTRVTSSGAPQGQWTADGLPVGNAPGAQTDLALVASDAGAAIAAWSDLRNFSHWDVYSNKIGPIAVLGVPPRRPMASPAVSAAPNPFLGSTHLGFDLVRTGHVTVRIFDARGRRVRTLLDGDRTAGEIGVDWDGRDAAGRAVGPGLYLAEVESGAARLSRKLLRLR